MVVKAYKVIGLTFDIAAAVVSLLDLTTDVIIMITWYEHDRMTFFYISLVILILAQISHIGVFYLNHGSWPNDIIEFGHTIISILFTIPFAPFLSFIFYMVSEQDSFLRNIIDKLCCYNFDWHHVQIDADSTPFQQYLEKKLYKHIGFITESVIEAFPESILQLTAIVYYNEPNIISIVSILISMCSVCGKLFLIVLGDTMTWIEKFLMWLTFVLDFFGIFFIVSYAFYSPTSDELEKYFVIIQTLCIYEFIVGVLPFAIIGSIGIHIYWSIKAFQEDPFLSCCYIIAITLLWALGLIFTLVIMQILCVFWFLLCIDSIDHSGRLPFEQFERKFFKQQIQWISNEKDHTNKVIKICVFNQVIIEESVESQVTNFNKIQFISYLENESKTEYKNVSLKDMRINAADPNFKYKIGDSHQQRIPYCLTAFWNETYLDAFGSTITDWKSDYSVLNFISMLFTGILTCICMPLYALTRIFRILLPLLFALYLYIDGNIVLFINIPLFQVIMWYIYVILLIIWFILFYFELKYEYYLWHLLPNVKKWKGWGDNQNQHTQISLLIKDTYFNMKQLPLIKQLFLDKFGKDITYIVMYYFNQFDSEAIIIEDMLMKTFNDDKIIFVIIDYIDSIMLNSLL